ncbi:ATP synthase F1 subunit epsilon [bacterium]|nr:ATP synthase F1 subunit epsilon [bacterium]
MTIEILSPSKALLKGEASEVIAPSVAGEVGILPQHTEYLTALQEGKLIVKQADGAKEFNITGGLLTVESNKVTVLVDGLAA